MRSHQSIHPLSLSETKTKSTLERCFEFDSSKEEGTGGSNGFGSVQLYDQEGLLWYTIDDRRELSLFVILLYRRLANIPAIKLQGITGDIDYIVTLKWHASFRAIDGPKLNHRSCASSDGGREDRSGEDVVDSILQVTKMWSYRTTSA